MVLYNYKPNSLKIGGVKIVMIRDNPNRGIVARLKDGNSIVLWDKNNTPNHLSDTEEQFIDRLKTRI